MTEWWRMLDGLGKVLPMFLKKLIASVRKFWINSRTRDDGERGRIIVERLLEMSKRPAVGDSSPSSRVHDESERKEA